MGLSSIEKEELDSRVEDDSIDRVCRICRSEETKQEQLNNPCLCSGSIKYVHKECLIRWIREGRHDKRWCELCGYEFEFVKNSFSPQQYDDDMVGSAGSKDEIYKSLLTVGILIYLTIPQLMLLILMYPKKMLHRMLFSKNLFPTLFIKPLFVVEFMYSIYFVFSSHRRWNEYFRIGGGKPAIAVLKDQVKVNSSAFLSVQFGLVIPFIIGGRVKNILFIIFSEVAIVDSVFIGQLMMFCVYSLIKILLEIVRKFHRLHDLVESLWFFKIALLIFFIFYATFGFLVDIISFPLSNGSFSMRFSGTSGTNPMSIGILYFLIGSEIIHFMSNPLVVSHFRKGVSFFRPISRNGHITPANIYSVPCLLFCIWIFSIIIKKLFPTYGPIRFISQNRNCIFDSVDEICLMLFFEKGSRIRVQTIFYHSLH